MLHQILFNYYPVKPKMLSNAKSYRVGTDKIRTTWDLIVAGKCNVIYEVQFLDKSGKTVGTNVEIANPVISVTKWIISRKENNVVVSFQVRAKYLSKNGNWTEPQFVSAVTASSNLTSSGSFCDNIGLLAGGIAGGLVLIIVIVIIVFMLKKKGNHIVLENLYYTMLLIDVFCIPRRILSIVTLCLVT